MEVEKVNSSQEVLGAPSASGGPPQGLDEAIQQKSSCITLKEFQKQGIKKLKVISQKSLEELINLAVEGELASRLGKEKEARIALEEEVCRLRKELETLNRTEGVRGAGPPQNMGFKGGWHGKLKEIFSEAIEEVKEGLGENDIPMDFIRNLEECLLRGLEAGLQPSSYSALSDRPTAEKETRPVVKRGGFFDSIIKENLQLRGANQGTSGAQNSAVS